jgi:hypothetical protein
MQTRPGFSETIGIELDVRSDDSDITIDSVTLRRLIEEVRIQETSAGNSYNRTYNRHNR